MTPFHQDPPKLENTYSNDTSLRALLRRLLPEREWRALQPELTLLGARAASDIAALGDAAEASPPRHVPFDAWGRRMDRVEVNAAWRALKVIAAEAGIVARAYERELDPLGPLGPLGAFSRIDQFARVYLLHPSSATVTCPFAMADGAARCLELHGGNEERLQFQRARLTSRDRDTFWTCGQWMTERTGGSDVSQTGTVARCEDGRWRLYGDKWFTSASDAEMALTLARAESPGAPGDLSLFSLETRDASGAWQAIRVHRLKDKLGTRALPTAEISLEGTPAILVGGLGHGVRKIAPVLTITRVWNTFCAASLMRRAVALAGDYARRRIAFGRPLVEHPLHAATLAALEVETRGALQLVFNVALLLGREECGAASDDDRALLRLLVPVAKLLTGKQAVAVISEALEAFGGAGYVEDSGLPRLLRDAQVLPIWEGTTNVLSLDVLRALGRTDALAALARHAEQTRVGLTSGGLRDLASQLCDRVAEIERYVNDSMRDADAAAAGARALALAIGRAYTGTLLLQQADWEGRSTGNETTARTARTAAERWCAVPSAPLVRITDAHGRLLRALLDDAAARD
jgi:alkylation response protein AidB-like acyl-CoA dehydrogenase